MDHTTCTGSVIFLALVEMSVGPFDEEIRTGAKAKATAMLPRRNTKIRAEW